jgi:DNA-binding MarR family transcriptional regulator
MTLNQERVTHGGDAFNLATTQRYFEAVAHARYVIRRVTRIVDDQAKRESLEPLEHQTLIQVCGARDRPIQINELAERLDIVAAFASRLVRDLESKGFVKRGRSDEDRRVTLVRITEKGARALARVDERVKLHVDVFKDQLSDDARAAAFRIFGFYVGMPVGEPDPNGAAAS